MKKLLFLITCIFFSVNISFAQDTLQKKQKNNSVLIDISAGISNKFTTTLSLKAIYSHKYNDHFSIGVGTGIYYNSYKEAETKSFSLDLPLFVNIRGDISKRKETSKIVPYYSLNAGYLFNVLKAKDEYITMSNNDSYQTTSLKYYEGLFFAPEIGININDIYIGFEFLYGTSKNEIHKNYLYPHLTSGKDESSYNTVSSYIFSLKFVNKL